MQSNLGLRCVMRFSYTCYYYGAWRSLVARLHGVQEVVGSSPAAPTIIIEPSSLGFGTKVEGSFVAVL
jgi:hypothetical protein